MDIVIDIYLHMPIYTYMPPLLPPQVLLDKARAYLGIAKGNSMLPAYQRLVTTDLDALLAWKNRRVPFVAV